MKYIFNHLKLFGILLFLALHFSGCLQEEPSNTTPVNSPSEEIGPVFSLVNWGWQQQSLIVVEYPKKYLQRGDLAFAKSLASALGDRVAIYLGHQSNSKENIVEALQPEGIQKGNLQTLIEDSDFQFLGYRRFNGTLSGSEKNKIVEFANRHLGNHSLFTLNPNASVALVESAFDYAGKSIMPSNTKLPFIEPSDQYLNTRLIDQLYIAIGDPFSIQIYGLKNSENAMEKVEVKVELPHEEMEYDSEGELSWESPKKGIYKIKMSIEGTSVSEELTLSVGGGALSGVVKDWTSQDGLADANIKILREGNVVKEINSNTNGSFNTILPVGKGYQVKVGKENYETSSYGPIRINDNQNYNIEAFIKNQGRDVEFGEGELFHVGNNQYSSGGGNAECMQELNTNELKGNSYDFHFEVMEDQTEVIITINKICGLSYPENWITLSYPDGTKSEPIILAERARGHGHLIRIQKTLNQGTHTININSQLLDGDYDDIMVGRIDIESDKLIERGDYTALNR